MFYKMNSWFTHKRTYGESIKRAVGAMRKNTNQGKTQRRFHQLLNCTKAIIALKSKRVNETGKVYFLECTYTQITVTFLAELVA